MNCFICYDLLRQTVYFINALLVVCFVSKQSKSCMKEKKARCHHSNLDREEIVNTGGREGLIVT